MVSTILVIYSSSFSGKQYLTIICANPRIDAKNVTQIEIKLTMSLSIGQNPGYINNIKTGKSKPSLEGIFFICEYLGVTPSEFFDLDSSNPSKANELYEIAKRLSSEQLDNLIALAKGLQKK